MEATPFWKIAKSFILFLVYFLAIFFTLKVALASGWNSSYVNSKDYELIHLPSFTYSNIWLLNFSTTDRARFQASGLDIVWTNSTNTSILNYELEDFTNNTATTMFWVQPNFLLANQNLTLFASYNYSNPTDFSNVSGVWSSDYLRVYHFAQNCSTVNGACVKDSSGNQNGTMLYTNSSFVVDIGRFGRGYFLNSSKINISLNRNTFMNYTVLLWINFSNSNYDQTHCMIGNDGAQAPFRFCIAGVNRQADVTFGSSGQCDLRAGNSLNDSLWHFLVMTANDTPSNKKMKLYIDGTNVANASGDCLSQNGNIQIGGINQVNNFSGFIDELRITKEGVVYDSDTVKQIYDSFNFSFMKIGSELPSSLPIINFVSINGTYTNTVWNCSFSVSDSDSDYLNVTINWWNGSSYIENYNYTFVNVTENTVYNNVSGGIPSSVGTAGEIWKCEITVTDKTNTIKQNSSQRAMLTAPAQPETSSGGGGGGTPKFDINIGNFTIIPRQIDTTWIIFPKAINEINQTWFFQAEANKVIKSCRSKKNVIDCFYQGGTINLTRTVENTGDFDIGFDDEFEIISQQGDVYTYPVNVRSWNFASYSQTNTPNIPFLTFHQKGIMILPLFLLGLIGLFVIQRIF